MTKTRTIALLLILFSSGMSIWWGSVLGRSVSGGPIDFQAVYYGSRTLLQHHNPYNVSELESVYRAEGGEKSSDPTWLRQVIVICINLPTALLLVAPLAMLPLGTAQLLWTILSAGVLILAALLMWDLAAKDAPILSACMIGFLIANCELVLSIGNSAAIAVGLCVAAAWCFLRERFVPVGMLCMAVSLLMKPHDAGLVWFYFLLAGGVHRKRALQTAALAAVLAIPAVIWVTHLAPHWIHDWQSNIAATSVRGGLNDPSPASLGATPASRNISLQGAFSLFCDDPRIYNLGSYLVCSALLLVWTITVLRSRASRQRGWLAVAAVVPLTMLITYHRVYDAKLLLLVIPACATLWAGGGTIGKFAVVLTAAGIVLNADVPITILGSLTDKLHLSATSFSGQIVTVLLARPNQEVLLAMCIFYLWVYARYSRIPTRSSSTWPKGPQPPEKTFDLLESSN